MFLFFMVSTTKNRVGFILKKRDLATKSHTNLNRSDPARRPNRGLVHLIVVDTF